VTVNSKHAAFPVKTTGKHFAKKKPETETYNFVLCSIFLVHQQVPPLRLSNYSKLTSSNKIKFPPSLIFSRKSHKN
jgi:hypothetical protein